MEKELLAQRLAAHAAEVELLRAGLLALIDIHPRRAALVDEIHRIAFAERPRALYGIPPTTFRKALEEEWRLYKQHLAPDASG